MKSLAPVFAVPVFAVVVTLLSPSLYAVESRTWQAAKGEYSIRGEAIAFNDSTVLIRRERSERLVAVEIAELSSDDQAFIAARREEDQKQSGQTQATDWHTWTSANGWQIRGRVLAYGRKELVVDRRSGVVTINGRAFSSLDAVQQRVTLAILSKLEDRTIENEQGLRAFASSLRGQPKQYTLEGVLLELESGDQVAAPFFLFSEKDLELLRSGWEAWLAAEDDENARRREDFLVQQEAMQYQAMQQRQLRHEQMEVLKLNLLATATGVTSIWEVALFPGPGTWGRPMTVVVSARTSQIAAQMAIEQHPGFVVGPIRRFSN